MVSNRPEPKSPPKGKFFARPAIHTRKGSRGQLQDPITPVSSAETLPILSPRNHTGSSSNLRENGTSPTAKTPFNAAWVPQTNGFIPGVKSGSRDSLKGRTKERPAQVLGQPETSKWGARFTYKSLSKPNLPPLLSTAQGLFSGNRDRDSPSRDSPIRLQSPDAAYQLKPIAYDPRPSQEEPRRVEQEGKPSEKRSQESKSSQREFNQEGQDPEDDDEVRQSWQEGDDLETFNSNESYEDKFDPPRILQEERRQSTTPKYAPQLPPLQFESLLQPQRPARSQEESEPAPISRWTTTRQQQNQLPVRTQGSEGGDTYLDDQDSVNPRSVSVPKDVKGENVRRPNESHSLHYSNDASGSRSQTASQHPQQEAGRGDKEDQDENRSFFLPPSPQSSSASGSLTRSPKVGAREDNGGFLMPTKRSTFTASLDSGLATSSALGFGGPSDWEHFGDYGGEEIDDTDLYITTKPKALKESSVELSALKSPDKEGVLSPLSNAYRALEKSNAQLPEETIPESPAESRVPSDDAEERHAERPPSTQHRESPESSNQGQETLTPNDGSIEEAPEEDIKPPPLRPRDESRNATPEPTEEKKPSLLRNGSVNNNSQHSLYKPESSLRQPDQQAPSLEAGTAFEAEAVSLQERAPQDLVENRVLPQKEETQSTTVRATTPQKVAQSIFPAPGSEVGPLALKTDFEDDSRKRSPSPRTETLPESSWNRPTGKDMPATTPLPRSDITPLNTKVESDSKGATPSPMVDIPPTPLRDDIIPSEFQQVAPPLRTEPSRTASLNRVAQNNIPQNDSLRKPDVGPPPLSVVANDSPRNTPSPNPSLLNSKTVPTHLPKSTPSPKPEFGPSPMQTKIEAAARTPTPTTIEPKSLLLSGRSEDTSRKATPPLRSETPTASRQERQANNIIGESGPQRPKRPDEAVGFSTSSSVRTAEIPLKIDEVISKPVDILRPSSLQEARDKKHAEELARQRADKRSTLKTESWIGSDGSSDEDSEDEIVDLPIEHRAQPIYPIKPGLSRTFSNDSQAGETIIISLDVSNPSQDMERDSERLRERLQGPLKEAPIMRTNLPNLLGPAAQDANIERPLRRSFVSMKPKELEDPYANLQPWARQSLLRYVTMLHSEEEENDDKEKYAIFMNFMEQELKVRGMLYLDDNENDNEDDEGEEPVEEIAKHIPIPLKPQTSLITLRPNPSLKSKPLPSIPPDLNTMPRPKMGLVNQITASASKETLRAEPRKSPESAAAQTKKQLGLKTQGHSSTGGSLTSPINSQTPNGERTTNQRQGQDTESPLRVTPSLTSLREALNNVASQASLSFMKEGQTPTAEAALIADSFNQATQISPDAPRSNSVPPVRSSVASKEATKSDKPTWTSPPSEEGEPYEGDKATNRQSIYRPYSMSLRPGSIAESSNPRDADDSATTTDRSSLYRRHSRFSSAASSMRRRTKKPMSVREVPPNLLDSVLGPLFETIPQIELLTAESEDIVRLRDAMNTVPDDFGFIHAAVLAWDAEAKRTRAENETKRQQRERDSEQRIDEMFNNQEIGYGDFPDLEVEFKRAEASRKAEEDRAEYQAFVKDVFDLVWKKLNFEIDQLTPVYAKAIQFVEEALAGREIFESADDRIPIAPAMESLLITYQKLAIRHQKLFEAVLERDRRLKKTEVGPWYALGNIKQVKKLKERFETAEKDAILKFCQQRDERANLLMDILDQNTLRGVGLNQDYMESVHQAVHKIATDITLGAVPDNTTIAPDEVLKAQTITTALARSSEQIVQTFHVADMLLNAADYEVSVANARMSNARNEDFEKLRQAKAKEDLKLVKDLEHRLSLIRGDTLRTQEEIARLLILIGGMSGGVSGVGAAPAKAEPVRASSAPVLAETRGEEGRRGKQRTK